MTLALKPSTRQRRAIHEVVGARHLHAVRTGQERPRLAPPRPRSSAIAEYRQAAAICGIVLMPWQDIAARYMVATKGKRWLYPEVAEVVARQNGKSAKLVPRIVMGLLRGERIMHTAQNRELPRAIYHQVAGIMETQFVPLLAHRPRYANGQELITMRDGGHYRVVAPNTAGARGYANDLVIIDEVREMNDFDFIGAARPTLTASANPQVLYLSNAGDDASVVLNALRKRAESDPQLAYLEWSAHPDRGIDDRAGWAEANPALGHTIDMDTLETAFRQLPAPVFETEHLCRWVTTMLPRVVSEVAWDRLRGLTAEPVRPVMGIAADPAGRRASAVVAWQADGAVQLYVLGDVQGEPVDLERFANEITGQSRRMGIRQVGYDAWTDRDLARYVKEATPLTMADYEAASSRFANHVEAGALRYQDDDGLLTGDMGHTVRRQTAHGWIAVRASDERPTTASIAAVRAVWLATAASSRPPQVY
jgi:hypothetical protein